MSDDYILKMSRKTSKIINHNLKPGMFWDTEQMLGPSLCSYENSEYPHMGVYLSVCE